MESDKPLRSMLRSEIVANWNRQHRSKTVIKSLQSIVQRLFRAHFMQPTLASADKLVALGRAERSVSLELIEDSHDRCDHPVCIVRFSAAVFSVFGDTSVMLHNCTLTRESQIEVVVFGIAEAFVEESSLNEGLPADHRAAGASDRVAFEQHRKVFFARPTDSGRLDFVSDPIDDPHRAEGHSGIGFAFKRLEMRFDRPRHQAIICIKKDEVLA